MVVATDAAAAHGVHSLLDVMIEYFEEMTRIKTPWITKSSNKTIKNSFSNSSWRRPMSCLFTMEVVLVETKVKGNLLSRINRLEERVLKLEEDINMKKAKKKDMRPRCKKKYNGTKKKIHPFPGYDQQSRKFHDEGTRLAPAESTAKNDLKADDATKAKKMSLLQKILHAGALNKPLEGFSFLWGSCRGTLVDGRRAPLPDHHKVVKRDESIRHKNVKIKRKEDEDTIKKTVLPMVNISKLKRLDGAEVSKLFSLQGMQSYSPWEMKYGL